MDNTIREFRALSPSKKKKLQLIACEYSLVVWNEFWPSVDLSYTDSVVGMNHEVDTELPLEAYYAVKLDDYSQSISNRYREPITAMQDWDLEFPPRIEFAYYSIYNLYQKYGDKREIDDWLIINQALSSCEDLKASDLAKTIVELIASDSTERLKLTTP